MCVEAGFFQIQSHMLECTPICDPSFLFTEAVEQAIANPYLTRIDMSTVECYKCLLDNTIIIFTTDNGGQTAQGSKQ